MVTTAEVYGYGARAPYAQIRESEYDMKERVCFQECATSRCPISCKR